MFGSIGLVRDRKDLQRQLHQETAACCATTATGSDGGGGNRKTSLFQPLPGPREVVLATSSSSSSSPSHPLPVVVVGAIRNFLDAPVKPNE
jgi:hypothetical protein